MEGWSCCPSGCLGLLAARTDLLVMLAGCLAGPAESLSGPPVRFAWLVLLVASWLGLLPLWACLLACSLSGLFWHFGWDFCLAVWACSLAGLTLCLGLLTGSAHWVTGRASCLDD